MIGGNLDNPVVEYSTVPKFISSPAPQFDSRPKLMGYPGPYMKYVSYISSVESSTTFQRCWVYDPVPSIQKHSAYLFVIRTAIEDSSLPRAAK